MRSNYLVIPTLQTMVMVGLGCLLALLILLGYKLVESDFIKYLLVGTGLLGGILFWEFGSAGWRSLLVGFLGTMALARIALLGLAVQDRVRQPYEWDFYSWYLHGNIATSGMDFYSPEDYHQKVAELDFPIPPSSNFMRGQVDVGFHYPPPTMFYFLPLGWMSFAQAQVLWFGLMIVGLGLGLFLTIRYLFPGHWAMGLLLVLNLALWSQTTRTVFSFAQTTFFLFLWVVLAWRYRSEFAGGWFLTLGVFTKPLIAALGIFPLIFSKWRVVWGGMMSVLGLSLLAGFVFGFDQFLAYFGDGPVNRIPDKNYIEVVNNSLLSVLIRNVTAIPEGTNPTRLPLYITLAGIMLASTLLVVWQLRKSAYQSLSLFTILSLSLLIYPASLSHYTFILALPLVWLWRDIGDWPRPWLLALSLLTLIWFAVGAWSPFWTNFAFWTSFLVLGIFALVVPQRLPPSLRDQPIGLRNPRQA